MRTMRRLMIAGGRNAQGAAWTTAMLMAEPIISMDDVSERFQPSVSSSEMTRDRVTTSGMPGFLVVGLGFVYDSLRRYIIGPWPRFSRLVWRLPAI